MEREDRGSAEKRNKGLLFKWNLSLTQNEANPRAESTLHTSEEQRWLIDRMTHPTLDFSSKQHF